jgi:hypothetical protein
MTAATWRPAKQLDDGTWETPGQCDPEACQDPTCSDPVHPPERESWTETEELASWLEEDRRAERRADR